MNLKKFISLCSVLLLFAIPIVNADSDQGPSKLQIVLPSELVQIKKMPVFVVLTDESGKPTKSEFDLNVNVRTFGNIDSQNSNVIIPEGKHYAMFLINIDGDGGIAIAASGFDPDTKNIKFEHKSTPPELQVRVAPNPIPPSSTAEVYVWFEQDGKPFIPTEDITIQLITEDEDFLTFSKNNRFNSNPTTVSLTSSQNIILKSGESFVKTKVFSTDFISEFNPDFGPDLRHEELKENQANEFVITALAEGFEGKQTDLLIQPAQTLDSTKISDNAQTDPTVTKVWAYPNIVFNDFEIIMAVYTQTIEKNRVVSVGAESNQEFQTSDVNETNVNNNGDDEETTVGGKQDDKDLSNSCQFCAPIVLSDSDINVHISTNELITDHLNSAKISASSFISRQNYVVISASSNGMFGEGKISAVFDGTVGDVFEIEIEQPFDSESKLGITPIPALNNQNQALMMVYGLENGVLSDIPINDLVVTTNPALDITIVNDFDAVKVIHATTGIVGGSVNVMALANGIIPASTIIDISSESIFLDFYPTKNQINFGDSFELNYNEIPEYVNVLLETSLPFDEIENGFKVYGINSGEHTLSLTAKNGDENLANKKITIIVNPVDPPTNSVIDDSNIQKPQNFLNYFFFDYLIYIFIAAIIMILGIIFLRKKTKRHSKNFVEEDLTF